MPHLLAWSSLVDPVEHRPTPPLRATMMIGLSLLLWAVILAPLIA